MRRLTFNNFVYSLLMCCIMAGLFRYELAVKNHDETFHWVDVKKLETDSEYYDAFKILNGKDTVCYDTGTDILSFIPDTLNKGYFVYSEISEDDHCLNWVSIDTCQTYAINLIFNH